MDETIEIIVGTAAFVLTVFAIVMAGAAAGIIAVPLAIGGAVYWHQVKSPTARERQQQERTWQLYREVKRKFKAIDIPDFLMDRIGVPDDGDANGDLKFEIAMQLIYAERLKDYPPEPPTLCNTIEGGRYRDFLNQVSPDDYEHRLSQICRVAVLCAEPPTTDNVANVIYTAVETFADGRPILPNTTKQLDDNYSAQKQTAPRDYKGDDIIRDYLRGTALARMAEMAHDDSIEIPHGLRTQHHSIIAGTGHGKTQCLQQMLLEDFEDLDSCVIVIDSQGSMLEKLLHVVDWGRCMYLDGGSIARPLALSAFAIGRTDRPEDEPKVRTAVALYEHMFAARDTALTTTQSTLYRFLSRFLMVIPNANFDTALEILQEGYEPYAEYVEKLDDTSRKFVTSELCDPKDKRASNSYRTTRQEVARRLFTLMESRTLKGMFNAPESRVDIPAAIRNKKIILINTAQAVLGDEGAQLFGKYCFAQIAMEVLARPETKDRVYLYLDEAHEYLSDSPIIRRLYEQGRKRGLCMVTACQELNQLERAGIDKMINGLTSIKFAGGVSAGDAGKLSKEMDTEAATLRGVPELTFAAWLKHHGTGTYKVTPGLLEARMQDDPDYVQTLKHNMLAEYHYHPDGEGEWDVEPDSDGPPDYDTYWDDARGRVELKPTNAKKRQNPKAEPHEPIDPDGPDPDDPIDPDGPQDLD